MSKRGADAVMAAARALVRNYGPVFALRVCDSARSNNLYEDSKQFWNAVEEVIKSWDLYEEAA